jgi:hypothetical protein
VPRDTPRGGASYGPSIDLEFLQTFIIVALNYISPDGPSPQFEPLDWLTARLIEIEETVQAVVANERLQPLLPQDGVEERAAQLVEAFRAMSRANEEREGQRVIDSPLDEAVVEGFKIRVRQEWTSNRPIAGALQRVGRYEVIENEPEIDFPKWGFALRWVPKNWLIGDGRVGGLDFYARELGRDLAESEMKLLTEAAAPATDVIPEEGESPARVVRRAIADLHERGQNLVAFVPHHWRWAEVLELTLSERRGGPALVPGWLPEALHDRFIGTADDVPVVAGREMPEERILVLAYDAFARWRQWRTPGEHEVTVLITAFDKEEALHLVAENPELFRSETRTTDEARARELRKNVLMDVHERVRVEVIDSEAVRWVQAPQELRRF